MEKEKQFEQIEAYLKGTLKGKEKTSFEQKIKADASLAEEVKIQKDMAKTLATSPKDGFRQTLKEINQEYSSPSNNIKAGAWVLLGILLFLLASIVFFMNKHDNTELIPVDEEVQNVSPPPSAQENRPVMPSEENEAIDIQNKQALRDLPQENKKEADQAAEPIALNFSPNPALEAYLNNPSRSNGLNIEIYQPFKNSTAFLQDGKINFSVEGMVQIEDEASTPAIQLLVFSNQAADYENFNSVYQQTLSLKEVENGLTFNISEQLAFTPGLYYLYFENLNSGEVYAVRKFNVKRSLD